MFYGPSRMRKVFHNSSPSVEVACRKIIYWCAEIKLSLSTTSDLHKVKGKQRIERDIRWHPPDSGLLKLNCDAAISDLGLKAAAGGVIRDALGAFILDFASALVPCSVREGELLAIYTGATLARRQGVDKLLIHSDSLLAVRLVTVGCSSCHPQYRLVRDIKRIMGMDVDDSYVIEHTLWEANQVADGLAKFGLNLNACSRLFHSVPLFVSAAVSGRWCWDLFSQRFLGVLSLFWLGLSPWPPPKKKNLAINFRVKDTPFL